MIDIHTMSSPVLPVETWLQISHQLSYEGCKVFERLNRSFRQLVDDPALAAIRFQEKEPDLIRRQRLFEHEGLSLKPIEDGHFPSVCHLPDVDPLAHPLFRCIDWTPAATVESLAVRWNPQGEWLERPVLLQHLDARHEKATSPSVNELAVSVECSGSVETDRFALYDAMPVKWLKSSCGVTVIEVLEAACELMQDLCCDASVKLNGRSFGYLMLEDLQRNPIDEHEGMQAASLRLSFARRDDNHDETSDEENEAETDYLTIKIGRPFVFGE
jgi:hypothetical protein